MSGLLSKQLALLSIQSKLIKSETGPSVYIIPQQEQQIDEKGCKKFSFGKESKTVKTNRTVMVLGATGAGKSTLINGMVNYILGIEWEDPYRFKLVDEDQSRSQAESQTSEVTVYKINHQDSFKIPSSLTIVDTPGFGDTRGIQRDKEITEQIRSLFSAKHGVTEIDAVCFVVQASLARLTATQQYVFDSVLSIFGKDVAENIQVLVTFADGQRPPVLGAINASGAPCPKTKDGLPVHFKFNNSALFAQNQSSAEEDGGFSKMFWDMGKRSMKKFFVGLDKLTPISLTMTKEVLRERKQLQISIESVQKQVKVGLAKIEEIKETTEQLKLHEADINRNEKFEFEVVFMKPFQEDISGTGGFLTNCQVCHFTCHEACAYANDADKIKCSAMGPDGNCTQCPGRCHWSQHFNQKYRWEYREVTVKQTVQEQKAKYMKASKAKGTVQEVIAHMKAENQRLQAEVRKMMKRAVESLNRLGEIALKPNPLSTPEYIDLLIEGEKAEAKSGWSKRVEHLLEVRGQAELMAKVGRGGNFL
ncbi:uncharacterized protein LOC117554153 [Gymnodraco acuticeps]|uniref:Uncharacterized protein LOC117554153 n=1 Tax=Gymnodraco acuticeps TaxID=8218 RepID=A0A6P8VC91_GYMAC|nr:uncharacterized protein LOC117554153 [Gymnodraco acuticeps]